MRPGHTPDQYRYHFGGSKMTRLERPKSEARRVEIRGQKPKAEAVNEDEFLGGGLAGAEQG